MRNRADEERPLHLVRRGYIRLTVDLVNSWGERVNLLS